ncbi:MurT ligase domain-containing protein [Alloscardovia venturai]|uniref:Lipid II isoglutaminyl synthase (glutamine-hydrolyzing) subunit MurT n=1 Tax=Alloscardovia venturai TaxID=1769421 RepID=A0ABW2Y2J9_9BIFI
MAHSLRTVLTPALGKTIRAVARLRGGGTALPGRVIESVDSDFMARTLAQLPYGVVLVSGTNGKTTTTRIVASMLKNLGLRVFTNPTGSNFTRGVVSALLDEVDMRGRLHADVAVLELDEAYAVHFVDKVKPRYALLLNVLRDQLDRFGEIDTTATMLASVAKATTGTVVLNREDSRVAALSDVVRGSDGVRVRYYGLSDDLMDFFPSDDAMYDSSENAELSVHATGENGVLDSAHERQPRERKFDLTHYRPAHVTLTALQDHTATFAIESNGHVESHAAELKLEGVYNAFNAAGALAVVQAIMEDGPHTPLYQLSHSLSSSPEEVRKPASLSALSVPSAQKLIEAVSAVTPAFGRGESIDVHGDQVELILVKNPMGFRLALKSFNPTGHGTMIVINDEYADGRDMSWLWDVDFTSLRDTAVDMVSGVRATDMALRLAYDEVDAIHVDDSISQALGMFIADTAGKPKHIYCTYTAMLAVRKALSQIADVEDVGL